MKFPSVTTQMKAVEQYFPAVLFIILYKVVLTFDSVYFVDFLKVSLARFRDFVAQKNSTSLVFVTLPLKKRSTCRQVYLLACTYKLA